MCGPGNSCVQEKCFVLNYDNSRIGLANPFLCDLYFNKDVRPNSSSTYFVTFAKDALEARDADVL